MTNFWKLRWASRPALIERTLERYLPYSNKSTAVPATPAIIIATVHCEVGTPLSIEEALDTLFHGIATALTLNPDILLLGATAGPLLLAALLKGTVVHEALAGSPDARQWLSQRHHQLHPPLQRLLHTLIRNIAFRAELTLVAMSGFSLLGNATKDRIYSSDNVGHPLPTPDFSSVGNQVQRLYTEICGHRLFFAPVSHFIKQLRLDNVPRIEETFAVLLPAPMSSDTHTFNNALPLAHFNCIVSAGGCWPQGYAPSAILQRPSSVEAWHILEMLSTQSAILAHTWQPDRSLSACDSVTS